MKSNDIGLQFSRCLQYIEGGATFREQYRKCYGRSTIEVCRKYTREKTEPGDQGEVHVGSGVEAEL